MYAALFRIVPMLADKFWPGGALIVGHPGEASITGFTWHIPDSQLIASLGITPTLCSAPTRLPDKSACNIAKGDGPSDQRPGSLHR